MLNQLCFVTAFVATIETRVVQGELKSFAWLAGMLAIAIVPWTNTNSNVPFPVDRMQRFDGKD